MSKKEKIAMAAILICTALIIIIPAIFSVKNNEKKSANSDSEFGDIVITENLGLSEDDVQDAEFEVTDGPTGGDETDIYNFQFQNASELINRDATVGLATRLYDAFLKYQHEHEEYKGKAVFTIDYDTYVDNDSQTAFEFSSERYQDTTFQLVYNKTDYTINISTK